MWMYLLVSVFVIALNDVPSKISILKSHKTLTLTEIIPQICQGSFNDVPSVFVIALTCKQQLRREKQ
ncbi:hypothetical protein MANES_13G089986v8 [Manihot esculenta]|uniref:Uncharacterized protein n=1 Tax=Manihot esculenta TaxID=3983 RepID=A0ACB7GKL8_MANES|nr:hypothetical protein MANES_13G089986v8 [Manihot esculenta]